MNQKLLIGIGVGVALLIFVGLIWAIVEYKQEQDLTQDVRGRWEHTNRDRILTVTFALDAKKQEQRRWKIEKWDLDTKGWHDVSHGTWSVRDSGTYIFVSDLTSATYPVRIEGDMLRFEQDDPKNVDQYRRMK